MAKIENVCVDIKVGKKEYHLKNLILDVYLNRYANCLIDDCGSQKNLMSICLIKFDTPLQNLLPDMKVRNDTFDIGIKRSSFDIDISTNKVTTKYKYLNDPFEYSAHIKTHKWSEYIGKKICTLGFNYDWNQSLMINAIIDVSNYDIYIEEGQDVYITRIDTISTDAMFTPSSDKIKGPVHLSPNGLKSILESPFNAYAKLTKVGLSNNPKEIQREFNLDYEVANNIFKIKNLYSPVGVYPSDNLYPSNDLYPDDIPYDYLVLKFVLYQNMDNGTNETPTDTGEWYLQTIPLRKNGKIDLNIKYERG